MSRRASSSASFAQAAIDESRCAAATHAGRRRHSETASERSESAPPLLCHVGRHEFDPAALKVVPEWPLVYWWARRIFDGYAGVHRSSVTSRRRERLKDCDNNTRFMRRLYGSRDSRRIGQRRNADRT